MQTIINFDAQAVVKDYRVMGTLLAKVINTTRDPEHFWCDLLLSGLQEFADTAINKSSAILQGIDFGKRERYTFINGHKPIANQHIYRIKRSFSKSWLAPLQLVSVFDEDIIQSPYICGAKFSEMCNICRNEKNCELLISAKKVKNLNRVLDTFQEMFRGLEHAADGEKWKINEIKNPVCSEHYFFEISC